MKSRRFSIVALGLFCLSLALPLLAYIKVHRRLPAEIIEQRVERRVEQMLQAKAERAAERQKRARERKEQLCTSRGWFPLPSSAHRAPGERAYTGNEPDCQVTHESRLTDSVDRKQVLCCTVRPGSTPSSASR